MPSTLEALKQVKAPTEEMFREFRSKRLEVMAPLVRGQYEPEVDDTLSQFAHRYAVLSQELRYENSARVRALMINSPKVDVVSLDKRERSKKLCEDVRVFLASWLSRFDHGRRLHQTWANSINIYGVSIHRLLWKEPAEPELADGEGDAEQRRIDAYLEQADECFKLIWVNPTQCAWGPNLSDPKHFLQDAVMTYWGASRLTNKAGKRVGLNEAGDTLAFYSEGEHPDFEQKHSASGKQVHFVIWEHEDEKTGKWMHCEYVYPEGSDLQTSGEQLTEFEIPHGQSSYFICSSGDENTTEIDPHLRYVAPLMPFASVIHRENFWMSIHGALSLQQASGRNVFHRIPPNVNDNGVRALEEMGLVKTLNNERWLSLKYPEPDSNEIASVQGEILPWPSLTPESINDEIQMCEMEKQRYRLNRYVAGEAGAGEVAQAPATSLLAQMEAAQAPMGADLAPFDRLQENILRAICNTILFFGKDIPPDAQPLYPVVASGDLPLMQGSIDPGEQVVITAEKLKGLRFDINVFTDKRTQAEKAVDDQRAYFDYAQKTLTTKQLFKELGHEDPEQQIEEVDKEGFLVEAQRLFAPQTEAEMQEVYTLMTGVPVLGVGGMGQAPEVSAQPTDNVRQPGPTGMMSAPVVQGATGGA